MHQYFIPFRKFTHLNFPVIILPVLLLLMLPTTLVQAAEKISVPFSLSKGVQLFNQYCAVCHGSTLEGTKQGPPMLHAFYKESHHGDSAFYRAALQGVKAHHWNFGDMPPVKGVTTKHMDAIVPYIRWYQKQTGFE